MGNRTLKELNKKQGFFAGHPMLKKYKKFIFPGVIAVLILLAIIFEYLWEVLPFNFSIIPLIIAGVFVTKSTVEAVVHLKKVTAGILVVMALIGTTYVGEYLAGAIVAFMMIFGEFLEEVTLDKTRNAVKELIKLVPDTVRIKINGKYEEYPISETEEGDLVLVKPGERIPVDGVIISGQAAINESSITGESMPVDKTIGDQVFVGTFNENGVLEIETEKIGSDTVLGKIIRTVHQAQNNKGEAQKAADKFAKYFVPIILVICAVVWFLTYDLMRVMTILVIACPCALVLATPTAVVASVGNAAKKGILIKGGVTIEKSAKITTLCLDKTGTITEGKPVLVNLTSFDSSTDEEVLRLAAIAEKNSQHPIARAVLEYAESKGIDEIPDSESFQILFGKGIRVKFDDGDIEVSNAKVLKDPEFEVDEVITKYLEDQENKGRTALLVIKNNTAVGGIAIADTVRSNMADTIAEIKKTGIKRILMLTGDNEVTARSIAEQVGITEYHANLLPNEKLNITKKLQSEGEVVAMVGDGVNDAPALALADVGIAMGAIGTDVAIEAADIALMADSLEMIPETLGLSRRTYTIIKQNIWFFAVLVNVVGIYLSGVGFLNPIMAAIVHNAASILVVVNSARLLTYSYSKAKNM
ncbi:cation-translocating P-type ATPase [Wukongibacter baidiensis]|uniref:heavy metal translocating P-type ATPase n=1 Tax=Wukongibacter baidiensis TaxID=1723361 RepID=UPI003D7F2EF6